MKILVNPVFSWETCSLESCERVYEHDGPVVELKKGKSKAPPPPDPAAVSAAQTQSNKDTAQYNAALGSGNVTTPLGSSTFTPRVDPRTGATVYDQTVSLTPDAQAQLTQELAQNRQLNTVAGGMLDRIGSQYANPMDTSGLPALNGAPTMGQYRTGYSTTGLPALRDAPNAQGYQRSVDVNGPNLVGNIDTAGLPELYGAADLEGARKQAQDALYSRQAAYLDPQWQQREDQFRTLMRNKGIVEGSEAWRNELDDLNRSRSFAYDRARESAIAGGGDEMARLVGISQGNRAQLYGERATGANFTNNARSQALAEALSRGQFANAATEGTNRDALAFMQAGNQARAQGVGEAADAAGFYNAATSAGNADALRAAQFGNQARTQGMEELFALRNQPLNEFNSLRQSSPVDVPSFSGFNAPTMQGTDVAGNIWNNYQGQMNIWNAQQQARNGMLGGLMSLGGSLGSAAILASDERVKENVEHEGALPDGTNVYSYNYIGESPAARQTGVMAQEVERTNPAAVITGPDGIKRVDYARVLGRALARAA